jgi:ribonucleoside-diphosphate reductase alpha chain
MQNLPQELTDLIVEYGARFTHHSSIAPTGTISLSLGNNVSNGIEPSFAHEYTRNVIREGKKSKENVKVYSYELLAYRELVNPNATADDESSLPDYFVTTNDISPQEHVAVQAAAQKWVDSSISKTANALTVIALTPFIICVFLVFMLLPDLMAGARHAETTAAAVETSH